jgi:KDO2-lipid IV(A) lauroyltransferase
MPWAGLYGLCGRILLAVPPPLRYGLAALAGDLFYLASPARRKVARANYARVLGVDAAQPLVGRVARHAFRHYAKLMADFALLPALSRADFRSFVESAGTEYLDEALAAGRGAVVVMPHFGNWDMAGVAAASLGYDVVTVANPFGPPALDKEVVRTRREYGVEMIRPGVALRGLLRALRDNRVVALVADIDPRGTGELVTLFGASTTMPGGPGALVEHTGAALLAVEVMRLPDNRYRARVLPPLVAPGERVSAGEAMARVAKTFEAQIARTPDQWYAFGPRWPASEMRPVLAASV